MTVLDFALPAALEAHEPPEARGLARSAVRLLVGCRSTGEVSHHAVLDLPALLDAGDVLVVNTSATLPAAVPTTDGSGLVVHFSGRRSDGGWLVELRRAHRSETVGATAPHASAVAGDRYLLRGGGTVVLIEPFSAGRLWFARIDVPDVLDYLRDNGEPIRYAYVPRPWPLRYYQTIFATQPGSAEMPSAARPFSHEIVTRLVTAGVLIVPIVLHTGVASAEAHERPYPEWFRVPAATARIVTQARRAGARVIAVGTTVVRAIESAAAPDGSVAGVEGWTELVVTAQRGVRAVTGLLTGLHEPRASHLDLLAAVAGQKLMARCYDEALAAGYLWHEFGDLNLVLP